jgi:Rad3-related DNA helicase
VSASFPTPLDIGIPGFADWRAEQEAAIERTLATDKRFMCAVMPVGSGKSLYAVGCAQFLGGRAIALTGTKALMQQYADDFTPAGLVQIKGQASYQCLALAPGGQLEQYGDAGKSYQSCEDGPCHAGVPCNLKRGGCLYYDEVEAATSGPLVSSNYAFWMATNRYGKGIGDFGTLILDEAHSVPERLAEFMTVEITQQDLRVVSLHVTHNEADTELWASWARSHRRTLERRLESWIPHTREDAKLHRKVRTIARKLAVLATMKETADSGWIVIPIKEEYKQGWKFYPLWAQNFAESVLYRRTKKIIAMSGTLTKKTIALMGIPENDYEWHEVGSSFPIANRPVFWIPTIRNDYRTLQNNPHLIHFLVNRIDQIIAPRLDRKGIIHCIAYKRAEDVLALSQFKDRIITHNKHNLAAKIAEFKRAPAGTIFLSPSVATGYDFKGPLAEYQIILKIPFPLTTDPVMKARTEKDKEYPLYLAFQELQQMVGRIVREYRDRGETFILDDNWAWVQKSRHLGSKWFWESVRKLEVIPQPPPPLDPAEWGYEIEEEPIDVGAIETA